MARTARRRARRKQRDRSSESLPRGTLDDVTELDALTEATGPSELDPLTKATGLSELDALAEPDAPSELDALAEPDAPSEPYALAEPDAPSEPGALAEPDAPSEPGALTEQVLDWAVPDEQTHNQPRGTVLSLTEAAFVTGRDRSTLRRYLEAGRFTTAYHDAGGGWRIPIVDVLSAGLLVRAPREDPDRLETALERLRAENAELRRRLDVAEALANERAARIRDLRLSLRMLPPTNPPARTIEAPESSNIPFVWSGEITQVDPNRS
jgi:hypothetical protein